MEFNSATLTEKRLESHIQSLYSHSIFFLSFGVQMMTSLESGGVELNQQIQERVVQVLTKNIEDI